VNEYKLAYRLVRLAYQPSARSTFLSEQTSHQQPASSTFLSEQTSTSHQPPAKRTGCTFLSKNNKNFLRQKKVKMKMKRVHQTVNRSVF
jgi:hypothetical protein